MAAPVGRTDPSIAEILLRAPWDFSFFQVVRLLALIYPERRAISGFRQPLEEIVRFHSHLSMAFPASAVQDITPGPEGDPHLHITVNFMGLTGPMGILPAHYTEYLIARSYSHDGAAAAFFDLFNHRLVSLFYLAWEKHHFTAGYQRQSQAAGVQSGFTHYLFDLIGMGTTGLQNRLALPDAALLSYCGLLAQRPRSASALAGMLRDYFGVPVTVEQFVGQWCSLQASDLCYLRDDSVSSQLGEGSIAGSQVWNPQARFRIRVGPLTWKRFQSFLPDGSAFPELITLARYFTNQAFDFEMQAILLAAEVRGCQLSDDRYAPRLGLSSWLKTEPFLADADELVLPVRSNGGL